MSTNRLEGNALVRVLAPLALASCDACGDDIAVHEWIDVDADGTMVTCDRDDESDD